MVDKTPLVATTYCLDQVPPMPTSGGVYSVTCEANGKVYFGSAANLYNRANNHRSMIGMQYHTNHALRADAKLYSRSRFFFAVVAYSDVEEARLAIEALMIGRTTPELLYNTTRKSGIHIQGSRCTLPGGRRRKRIRYRSATPRLPACVRIGGRTFYDEQAILEWAKTITTQEKENRGMKFEIIDRRAGESPVARA